MSSSSKMAIWLKEKVLQIKNIEDEANAVLAAGDSNKYGDLMRQKAGVLSGLASSAEAMTADLPPAVQREVLSKLANFSQNARNSLDLDSTFYMSALLYPDDHKPGEPNNLEKLLGFVEGQELTT